MTERPESNRRRGLLRALGAAAGVAAAPAMAESIRADAVPRSEARKENTATRVAARYRETPHVAAFYRTNRYEH